MDNAKRRMNLGDVLVKGTLTFATNNKDFPETPIVGEVAFVNGALYIFTKINNIQTWYQLTEKRDTYTHVQGKPSKEWSVNHNFSTEKCSFFAYVDNSLNKNHKVTFQDNNRILVAFDEEETGTLTVFKFPEVVTSSVTTDTIHVKENLKWKSFYWQTENLPDPSEHMGMTTLVKSENRLVFSDGIKWKTLTTQDVDGGLIEIISSQIDIAFGSVDYNQLLNQPDLNNIEFDWKNIKNVPDFGDNTYPRLKNKPVLVHSDEVEVFNDAILKYEFTTNTNQNLSVNRDWIQLYINGLMISPSKYNVVGSYGIELNYSPAIGDVIQITTIKT